MNDGLKSIFRNSFLITLGLCLVLLVPIVLLWPKDSLKGAVFGLFWGAGIGLAGLFLICSMVAGMSESIRREKTRGQTGYIGRYILYGLCLFAGAWMQFSVLTMLGGILAQKASLVLYALKERKDCP